VTWLNTSVQTGFARSASEAMFPRLFPDAGWWCPSLNPAMGGTRLWDLSGRQNWATLTNMANDDWVVRSGKGMLDFDASNDFASTSASSSYNVGNSVTVSAFAFPTSNGTAGEVRDNAAGANRTATIASIGQRNAVVSAAAAAVSAGFSFHYVSSAEL